MRPLLLLMSTGSMSLYQEISGSGFPLAAHSMVAVRVLSTTLSCGPMSMEGKPWGTWFSEIHKEGEGGTFGQRCTKAAEDVENHRELEHCEDEHGEIE